MIFFSDLQNFSIYKVFVIMLCLLNFEVYAQENETINIERIKWNNSEYAFIRHVKPNLKDAVCECGKLDMVLVKIESASENKFITTTAFKREGIKAKDGNQYWIGASDAKEEGDWLWVADSTKFFNQNTLKAINNSFTNWGKTKIGRQPNNYFKNNEYENCAVIRDDGLWYDIGCKTRFSYVICEKKLK